jgi:hypothetical protein
MVDSEFVPRSSGGIGVKSSVFLASICEAAADDPEKFH